MGKVSVLIVVDALGAATSGNLQSNVYLIDTNKHIGSGNEGQAELKTVCKEGDIITWRVSPVSPDSDVSITGFTGQIITKNVCNPVQQGIAGDYFWEGRVETQGQGGTYQYSAKLTIDGKEMQFDPYIIVKES